MRHRLVGHFAAVHANDAGHGGAAQSQELWEADVSGQGSTQAATGCHDRGLYQHDALSADAHQPTPLQ